MTSRSALCNQVKQHSAVVMCKVSSYYSDTIHCARALPCQYAVACDLKTTVIGLHLLHVQSNEVSVHHA